MNEAEKLERKAQRQWRALNKTIAEIIALDGRDLMMFVGESDPCLVVPEAGRDGAHAPADVLYLNKAHGVTWDGGAW